MIARVVIQSCAVNIEVFSAVGMDFLLDLARAEQDDSQGSSLDSF